ncbi:30S ribosomal protein S3ae [Candidatus Micrarchaeota archaeon]|nr:30S ribosomal protein S3ae [Candidatus Micrarchaeota archaeon]
MAKEKIVDTWKSKTWYTVLAPQMFENKEIGQIPATEDAHLMNRIVKVSLAELTGDMSQSYVNLNFRINEVKGKTAYTKLIGHEISAGYLRTLVRRRSNVVNEVVDVESKDGVKLRIKISIFTARRVSSPVKTALRNSTKDEVLLRVKEMDFQQLAQEIIFGKFSATLFNRLRKLCPVKRIEVRKAKVFEKFA